MRRSLVGALVMFGIVAALPAYAGPGGAKGPTKRLYFGGPEGPAAARAAVPDDVETPPLAPICEALEPFFGTAPTPALRLISDEKTYFAIAARAGESDATVVHDNEKNEIVALGNLNADRLRLIAHETARAHVRAALGAAPSPWLEAGLGCYVETAETRDGKTLLGKVDADRRARARAELKGADVAKKLDALFALERTSFVRGERVHRDVSVAWALVHYLIHGGEKPRKALAAYVRELRDSRDPVRAEGALFSVLSRSELAKGLEEHLKKMS